MESLNAVELCELGDGDKPAACEVTTTPRKATQSRPRIVASTGIENTSYQDEEHETRFSPQGADSSSVHLSTSNDRGYQSQPRPFQRDELSHRSEAGHETDFKNHSLDYGFLFAMVFLVSGIVLVVIAYTIPREAKVNPDLVSARQMEKLEMYYTQLGSHLDKCIIAGLGLLTLGGMLLSILLMVSICKESKSPATWNIFDPLNCPQATLSEFNDTSTLSTYNTGGRLLLRLKRFIQLY
ncbi:transmembrane protein 74B isoform X2 [Oncorhynchus nerka]|uniref:transmembrane protein 74B isoform X2 n=1 Tax=Oncorhynchus nerka TaxID=8023 RepID=UPI001130BB2C|nr:transmembrane protein 74B-like [Oncorhynchus nerka]